jgi:Ca-activated chloride channel family protein
VILGRYAGAAPTDASIAIEGTSFGDPLKLTIARDPIANAPRNHAGWLAASWARAHIRDLEDRYAAGDHSVEATIVKTSKQFSVLSRFTAFLAIDRSEIANKGGHLNQVVQPVESPAGWEMAKAAVPRRSRVAMPMQAIAAAPMAPMGPPPGVGGGAMKTAAFDVDDEYAASAFCEESPAMELDELPRAMDVGESPPPLAQGRSAFAPPPAPARSAPPKPAPSPGGHAPAKRKAEAARRDESDATVSAASAYLVQLGMLARELEAHAGGPNTAAIRLLRQRLTEWVEDLRSVGSNSALADAVEQLVVRLTAALAGTDLASEATAIAHELLQLAGGAPPPAPAKKSRLAFWK